MMPSNEAIDKYLKEKYPDCVFDTITDLSELEAYGCVVRPLTPNDQGERQPPNQQNRTDDPKLNKNQNLAAVRSTVLLGELSYKILGTVAEGIEPPVALTTDVYKTPRLRQQSSQPSESIQNKKGVVLTHDSTLRTSPQSINVHKVGLVTNQGYAI
mgnify:CR=1 FL=1